jgi:hypothetical protein
MKIKILAIISILFIITVITIPFVFGQTNYDQYFTKDDNVTFAWDYTTNPDVLGFNLYYHSAAGGPTIKMNSTGPQTTYPFKHLPIGSWIFSVTAYDKYGMESDNSTAIQVNKKNIKPGVVTTLRISNPAFVILIKP